MNPLSWSMRLALLQIYRSGPTLPRHYSIHLNTLWALQRRGYIQVSGHRAWLTLNGRIRGERLAGEDDLRRRYLLGALNAEGKARALGLLDSEAPEGLGADHPIPG